MASQSKDKAPELECIGEALEAEINNVRMAIDNCRITASDPEITGINLCTILRGLYKSMIWDKLSVAPCPFLSTKHSQTIHPNQIRK